MSRIIGGTAGGRRLRMPPGPQTRPTSDRVREALFSAIESALGSLAGLRFLDLYAGSGAVGLEAASRGAATVTLVERDRRTAALARDNGRSLGLAGVEVVGVPVSRHLQGRPPATAYDVVFLDPPYSLPGEEVVADLRALTGGWLSDGALVVVERSSRTGEVAWPEGYRTERVRRYGETALGYATWTGRGSDALRYGHDHPDQSSVQPSVPPAQEP
jgi:16S rRNA (guanine966-N2)-methyltransferase